MSIPPTDTGPGDDVHGTVRALFGAYVLDWLTRAERETVATHVLNCADCRAELTALRPLATPRARPVTGDTGTGDAETGETETGDTGTGDTAREPSRPNGFALTDVGATRIRTEVVTDPPPVQAPEPAAAVPVTPRNDRPPAPPSAPPPAQVPAATATATVDRMRPLWLRLPSAWIRFAAAAVTIALAAAGLGSLLSSGGSGGSGEGDPVAVRVLAPGLTATVGVASRTWGTELTLTGTGFGPGQGYRAGVLDQTGKVVSAGGFVGTGDAELHCTLTSPVPRERVTGFVVTDGGGKPVLGSDLTRGRSQR